MKELDITEGLSYSVWSSLHKAINSNSVETIDSFITFFRKVLSASISYRKFDPFKEFIGFPVKLYVEISLRNGSDSNTGKHLVEIPEIMSLHLKEIIMMLDYGKKYSGQQPMPLDFYYNAFRTFNDLLYHQARFQDWNLLEGSLNRLGQLNALLFSSGTSKTLQLRRLLGNRKAGDEAEINRLNKEIDYQSQLDSFRRQILTAIKYWLFFLADNNILNDEHLNRLIVAVNKGLITDWEKEVEDILFFRTEDVRRYMGWENWDFMERPESEMYSPPIAAEWMTFGFVLDRLQTRNFSFITSLVNSKLRRTIPYFYEEVQKNIQFIKRDFKKWERILRVNSIDDLDSIAEKLLSSISLATRNVVGEKEKSIASTPLDSLKVDWFKMEITSAWKEQTRIRRIFDYFENKENVTDQNILLKRVGTNNFLEKGKVHFIEGDYNMTIYGLNDFGAMIGRWENNLFMDVIERSEPTVVVAKTLISVLDEAFRVLKKSDVIPTAIILEPEFLYKDEKFIQSSRYTSTYKSEYNPDNIDFFVIGEFDGIPLFSFYSQELKDKVIISNFEDSFLMRYKTNDKWMKNELAISVEEVSDEIANKKYNDNPEKWRSTADGSYISEEDAKIIIKNSVIIDVETIIDYEVKDISQFVVGIITESSLE